MQMWPCAESFIIEMCHEILMMCEIAKDEELDAETEGSVQRVAYAILETLGVIHGKWHQFEVSRFGLDYLEQKLEQTTNAGQCRCCQLSPADARACLEAFLVEGFTAPSSFQAPNMCGK